MHTTAKPIPALIAALLAATLTGCSAGTSPAPQDAPVKATSAASHAITIADGKEYIEECPASAKAGEVVQIRTLFVTDADMYVNVSGANAERNGEGVYEFVMPDQPVKVTVTIDTSNYNV